MIKAIKSWLFRKVAVVRAHPEFDVAHLIIDCADGSEPQELLLSRNNLFALAWVIRRVVEDSRRGKTWHSVSFTVSIPCPGGSLEEHKITVPDWARNKLYRAVDKLAIQFGWDQIQCPKPSPHHAFR